MLAIYADGDGGRKSVTDDRWWSIPQLYGSRGGRPGYTATEDGKGWTRKLTREESTQLLDLVSRLTIGFAPGHLLGLDGTSYELTISSGMNTLNLHWWMELPDGWSEVREIVTLIESL